MSADMQELCAKAARERITPAEAALLLSRGDPLELGQVADQCRRRHQPGDRTTFIIDRNINYTNICTCQCRFCAFFRSAAAPDAYLLSPEEILVKVGEAVSQGATQVMIQGGLHPDLRLEYFEETFHAIKAACAITIHSLSPPEIAHLASRSGSTIREVLARLHEAGLDSLPGGGAEILVDRVRTLLSPRKICTDDWLAVMETAHSLGIESTATMMMGTVETLEERVEHMQRVRSLQDRTSGFRAFIPWTCKPANTALGSVSAVSAIEYLRTLAVARIFLDNIPVVQGSWVTQGRDVGQMSLHFGASDLGSIMLEENVVRAAGVQARITEAEMVALIRSSGKVPAQRDTTYRIIRDYPLPK